METFLLPLILFAVLITSFLSGIFGMAGGLILMGVLGTLLPVNTAMVLHGAAQFIANGARAVTLMKHVEWKSIGGFSGGSILAAAIFGAIQFVPSKPLLFLILGAVPFLSLVRRIPQLHFERPRHAFLAGVAVTAVALVSGVSGPLLDFFFIHSRKNRFQVIATKAVASAIGHLMKLLYFGALISGAVIDATWYPMIFVASVAGTLLGGQVLKRLNDENFRVYSRRIILVIGSVYLVRGIWALMNGSSLL